jgi:hypothetical protein
MSEPVEMPALLTVFGASPASATVTVMPLGIGHRLARALGALLTCWGAAVVAVFIPVAHFLVVPGRPWRDWSGLSSGFARATGSGRCAADSIVSAPLMRPR